MLSLKKAMNQMSKDIKQYRKGKIATPVANTRVRQHLAYSQYLWLQLRDEKPIKRITNP